MSGALLIIACLAVGAAGSYGPNVDLAWVAAGSLAIGLALLWRPGEPLILAFIFLLQWVQGSAAIYQATLRGVSVEDLYDAPGAYRSAILLTHGALVALAIGMRLAAGPIRPQIGQQIRHMLHSRPVRTWFQIYVFFWVLGAIANYGASLAQGLSQIFLGMASLRWAFFFLLAAAHFSQRRQSGFLFYVAFAFELALGLGGYFSSFKTVFMVTLLALATSGTRPSLGIFLVSVPLTAGALFLGILWTAIKPEYRSYVSGGELAQVVNVGYAERMEKLFELGAGVDNTMFAEAGDTLVSRLSYIEFFGATLLNVPAGTPHEGGALMADAIIRPFTPRLFFPGKTIIDDSERTMKYTGRYISGAEVGTSISLGWVAETYIDFGRWFMMVAALAIGAFYGAIQRSLLDWRLSSPALGAAAATAILLSATFLESSITKVTGGLIASLLAMWLMLRFVVPLVAPWLLQRPIRR